MENKEQDKKEKKVKVNPNPIVELNSNYYSEGDEEYSNSAKNIKSDEPLYKLSPEERSKIINERIKFIDDYFTGPRSFQSTDYSTPKDIAATGYSNLYYQKDYKFDPYDIPEDIAKTNYEAFKSDNNRRAWEQFKKNTAEGFVKSFKSTFTWNRNNIEVERDLSNTLEEILAGESKQIVQNPENEGKKFTKEYWLQMAASQGTSVGMAADMVAEGMILGALVKGLRIDKLYKAIKLRSVRGAATAAGVSAEIQKGLLAARRGESIATTSVKIGNRAINAMEAIEFGEDLAKAALMTRKNVTLNYMFNLNEEYNREKDTNPGIDDETAIRNAHSTALAASKIEKVGSMILNFGQQRALSRIARSNINALRNSVVASFGTNIQRSAENAMFTAEKTGFGKVKDFFLDQVMEGVEEIWEDSSAMRGKKKFYEENMEKLKKLNLNYSMSKEEIADTLFDSFLGGFIGGGLLGGTQLGLRKIFAGNESKLAKQQLEMLNTMKDSFQKNINNTVHTYSKNQRELIELEKLYSEGKSIKDEKGNEINAGSSKYEKTYKDAKKRISEKNNRLFIQMQAMQQAELAIDLTKLTPDGNESNFVNENIAGMKSRLSSIKKFMEMSFEQKQEIIERIVKESELENIINDSSTDEQTKEKSRKELEKLDTESSVNSEIVNSLKEIAYEEKSDKNEFSETSVADYLNDSVLSDMANMLSESIGITEMFNKSFLRYFTENCTDVELAKRYAKNETYLMIQKLHNMDNVDSLLDMMDPILKKLDIDYMISSDKRAKVAAALHIFNIINIDKNENGKGRYDYIIEELETYIEQDSLSSLDKYGKEFREKIKSKRILIEEELIKISYMMNKRSCFRILKDFLHTYTENGNEKSVYGDLRYNVTEEQYNRIIELAKSGRYSELSDYINTLKEKMDENKLRSEYEKSFYQLEQERKQEIDEAKRIISEKENELESIPDENEEKNEYRKKLVEDKDKRLKEINEELEKLNDKIENPVIPTEQIENLENEKRNILNERTIITHVYTESFDKYEEKLRYAAENGTEPEESGFNELIKGQNIQEILLKIKEIKDKFDIEISENKKKREDINKVISENKEILEKKGYDENESENDYFELFRKTEKGIEILNKEISDWLEKLNTEQNGIYDMFFGKNDNMYITFQNILKHGISAKQSIENTKAIEKTDNSLLTRNGRFAYALNRELDRINRMKPTTERQAVIKIKKIYRLAKRFERFQNFERRQENRKHKKNHDIKLEDIENVFPNAESTFNYAIDFAIEELEMLRKKKLETIDRNKALKEILTENLNEEELKELSEMIDYNNRNVTHDDILEKLRKLRNKSEKEEKKNRINEIISIITENKKQIDTNENILNIKKKIEDDKKDEKSELNDSDELEEGIIYLYNTSIDEAKNLFEDKKVEFKELPEDKITYVTGYSKAYVKIENGKRITRKIAIDNQGNAIEGEPHATDITELNEDNIEFPESPEDSEFSNENIIFNENAMDSEGNLISIREMINYVIANMNDNSLTDPGSISFNEFKTNYGNCFVAKTDFALKLCLDKIINTCIMLEVNTKDMTLENGFSEYVVLNIELSEKTISTLEIICDYAILKGIADSSVQVRSALAAKGNELVSNGKLSHFSLVQDSGYFASMKKTTIVVSGVSENSSHTRNMNVSKSEHTDNKGNEMVSSNTFKYHGDSGITFNMGLMRDEGDKKGKGHYLKDDEGYVILKYKRNSNGISSDIFSKDSFDILKSIEEESELYFETDIRNIIKDSIEIKEYDTREGRYRDSRIVEEFKKLHIINEDGSINDEILNDYIENHHDDMIDKIAEYGTILIYDNDSESRICIGVLNRYEYFNDENTAYLESEITRDENGRQYYDNKSKSKHIQRIRDLNSQLNEFRKEIVSGKKKNINIKSFSFDGSYGKIQNIYFEQDKKLSFGKYDNKTFSKDENDIYKLNENENGKTVKKNVILPGYQAIDEETGTITYISDSNKNQKEFNLLEESTGIGRMYMDDAEAKFKILYLEYLIGAYNIADTENKKNIVAFITDKEINKIYGFSSPNEFVDYINKGEDVKGNEFGEFFNRLENLRTMFTNSNTYFASEKKDTSHNKTIPMLSFGLYESKYNTKESNKGKWLRNSVGDKEQKISSFVFYLGVPNMSGQYFERFPFTLDGFREMGYVKILEKLEKMMIDKENVENNLKHVPIGYTQNFDKITQLVRDFKINKTGEIEFVNIDTTLNELLSERVTGPVGGHDFRITDENGNVEIENDFVIMNFSGPKAKKIHEVKNQNGIAEEENHPIPYAVENDFNNKNNSGQTETLIESTDVNAFNQEKNEKTNDEPIPDSNPYDIPFNANIFDSEHKYSKFEAREFAKNLVFNAFVELTEDFSTFGENNEYISNPKFITKKINKVFERHIEHRMKKCEDRYDYLKFTVSKLKKAKIDRDIVLDELSMKYPWIIKFYNINFDNKENIDDISRMIDDVYEGKFNDTPWARYYELENILKFKEGSNFNELKNQISIILNQYTGKKFDREHIDEAFEFLEDGTKQRLWDEDNQTSDIDIISSELKLFLGSFRKLEYSIDENTGKYSEKSTAKYTNPFSRNTNVAEFYEIEDVINVIRTVSSRSNKYTWNEFLEELKNIGSQYRQISPMCKQLYDKLSKLKNEEIIHQFQYKLLNKEECNYIYLFSHENTTINIEENKIMQGNFISVEYSAEKARNYSVLSKMERFAIEEAEDNRDRAKDGTVTYSEHFKKENLEMINEINRLALESKKNKTDYKDNARLHIKISNYLNRLYGYRFDLETIRRNEKDVKSLLNSISVIFKKGECNVYTENLQREREESLMQNNTRSTRPVPRIVNIYGGPGKNLLKLISENMKYDPSVVQSVVKTGGVNVNNTTDRTYASKQLMDLKDENSEMRIFAEDQLIKRKDGKINQVRYLQLTDIEDESQFNRGLIDINCFRNKGRNAEKYTQLDTLDRIAVESMMMLDVKHEYGFNDEFITFMSPFGKDDDYSEQIHVKTRYSYTVDFTDSNKTKAGYWKIKGVVPPSYSERHKGFLMNDYVKYARCNFFNNEIARIVRIAQNGMIPRANESVILTNIKYNNIIIDDKGTRLSEILYKIINSKTRESLDSNIGILKMNWKTIIRAANDITSEIISSEIESLTEQKIEKRSGEYVICVEENKDKLKGCAWEKCGIFSMKGDEIKGGLLNRHYVKTINEKPSIGRIKPENVVQASIDVALNNIVNRNFILEVMYGGSFEYIYSEKMKDISNGTGIYSLKDLNKMRIKVSDAVYKRMAGILTGGKIPDFSMAHEESEKWGGENGQDFLYLNCRATSGQMSSLYEQYVTYNYSKTVYNKETKKNEYFDALSQKVDIKEINRALLQTGSREITVEDLKGKTFRDIKNILYSGKINGIELEGNRLKEIKKTTKTILENRFPKVAAYLDIDSSDGQEWCTWREALDILYCKGVISKKELEGMRMLYENLSKNPKYKPNKEEKKLLDKSLQVFKPVYFGHRYVYSDGTRDPECKQRIIRPSMAYVKSSLMPLLPQMTRGTKLDGVRKAMEALEEEKKMNVHLSFDSAIKIGGETNLEIGEVENNETESLGKRMTLDEIRKNAGKNTKALNASSFTGHRKYFSIQNETDTKFQNKLDKKNQSIEHIMQNRKLFSDRIESKDDVKPDGKSSYEYSSNLVLDFLNNVYDGNGNHINVLENKDYFKQILHVFSQRLARRESYANRYDKDKFNERENEIYENLIERFFQNGKPIRSHIVELEYFLKENRIYGFNSVDMKQLAYYINAGSKYNIILNELKESENEERIENFNEKYKSKEKELFGDKTNEEISDYIKEKGYIYIIEEEFSDSLEDYLSENSISDRFVADFMNIVENINTSTIELTQLDHILTSGGISNMEDYVFDMDIDFISEKNYYNEQGKKISLWEKATGEDIEKSSEANKIKEIGKCNGRQLEKIRTAYVSYVRINNMLDLYVKFGILTKEEAESQRGKSNITISSESFKNNIAVKKLKRYISDKMMERGYNPNIEDFLETRKSDGSERFIMPLFFNPNSEKIENVLSACIKKDISRNHINGSAFFTATSEYFEKDESILSNEDGSTKKKVIGDEDFDILNNDGIIWIDPNREPGKLRATKVNYKEKECLVAECAVSPQFSVFIPGENGKPGRYEAIDLMQKDENGNYKYLANAAGETFNESMAKGENRQAMYLNTNAIDPKLLEMMSLRVPTSGHMSASALKIVAFLPKSNASTIIVPQDHVTQFGEDFDIDKRFCYTYNYYVDRNGNIRMITRSLINDLKKEYSRIPLAEKEEFFDKLEKKLESNHMVDMYLSVFKSYSYNVQKKISAVLGWDTLQRTKDLIISETKEKEDLNENTVFPMTGGFMEQIEVGVKSSSGQIGVGAFSNDVVFSGLLQKVRVYDEKNKSHNGNGVIICETAVEDGIEREYEVNIKIDGFTFNGDLSDANTLSRNEERTKVEMIAAQQNVNLDTVKVNIISWINQNKETLPFFSMMINMGFDMTNMEMDENGNVIDLKVDLASMICIQPIVKYFTELEMHKRSVIGRYSKSIENIEKTLEYFGFNKDEVKKFVNGEDIENGILKNYTVNMSTGVISKKGIYDEGKVIYDYDNIKAAGLLTGINASTEKIRNSDRYKEFMLDVLSFYTVVRQESRNLKGYKDLLNVNSHGVGKRYLSINDKINLLNRLGSQKRYRNLKNTIGIFIRKDSEGAEPGFFDIPGLKYYIKPTTIEGTTLLLSIQCSQQLLGNSMNYTNENIMKLISNVDHTLQERGLYGEEKDRLRGRLLYDLKSYVYMQALSELEETFFVKDENIENDTYCKNMTAIEKERARLMVSKYLNIKKEHPNTKIKRPILNMVIRGINSGKIERLYENPFIRQFDTLSSGALRFTFKANQDYSTSMFVDAFLELWNSDRKILKNQDYTDHDLARDLVSYAFISDDGQGIRGFKDIIPVQILKEIGFIDKVNEIWENIDTRLDLNNFELQFYESNYIDMCERLNSFPVEIFNGEAHITIGDDIEKKLNKLGIYDEENEEIIGNPVKMYFWVETKVGDNEAKIPYLYRYNHSKSENATLNDAGKRKHIIYDVIKIRPKEITGVSMYDPDMKVNSVYSGEQSFNKMSSNIFENEFDYSNSNTTKESIKKLREKYNINEEMIRLLENVLEMHNIKLSIKDVEENLKDKSAYCRFYDEKNSYEIHLNYNGFSRKDISDKMKKMVVEEEIFHIILHKYLKDGNVVYVKDGKIKGNPDIEKGTGIRFEKSIKIFNDLREYYLANKNAFKELTDRKQLDNIFEARNGKEITVRNFDEFLANIMSNNISLNKLITEFGKDKNTDTSIYSSIFTEIKEFIRKLINIINENFLGNVRNVVAEEVMDTLQNIYSKPDLDFNTITTGEMNLIRNSRKFRRKITVSKLKEIENRFNSESTEGTGTLKIEVNANSVSVSDKIMFDGLSDEMKKSIYEELTEDDRKYIIGTLTENQKNKFDNSDEESKMHIMINSVGFIKILKKKVNIETNNKEYGIHHRANDFGTLWDRILRKIFRNEEVRGRDSEGYRNDEETHEYTVAFEGKGGKQEIKKTYDIIENNIELLENTKRQIFGKGKMDSFTKRMVLSKDRFFNLNGNEVGINGEPDCILVDEKGTIHIIDFKTRGKEDLFSGKSEKTMKNYIKQLAMYKLMLIDMLGIHDESMIKTYIYQIKYDTDEKNITESTVSENRGMIVDVEKSGLYQTDEMIKKVLSMKTSDGKFTISEKETEEGWSKASKLENICK